MENLRIGNKQLIKDLNRALVIDRIRNYGPISRTDISKETKLGLSTVTNIVEELKNTKLIFEVGEASSSGGRRPILLEFNYQFGYAIGIKIEESHIVIALTDLRAKILDKVILSFTKGAVAEEVISLIVEGVRRILNQANISEDKLLRIGIAVSGLINGQKGIVLRSTLLGWNNVNLGEQIEKEFGIPTHIDNDVNAYTLAELSIGYGKSHGNFICISVGAGIGAGIVIDKKLYLGQFGGAGEFGHTIINVNGHQCHCGQRGCLEMYASEKFLVKEGALLSQQFKGTVLEGSDFAFDLVYEAALKRDALGLELLKRLGEYLGVGLINVINSLNPETIILAGEGIIAKDFFLPYVQEAAKQNFFSQAGHHTNIVISELGNDAWVTGAALIAINQLFPVPIYDDPQTKTFNLIS